jgi:hypothetical protein
VKDYIYLDTDMLNSTLAQIDQGLLNSFGENSDHSNSRSDSSEKTSSKGIEGFLQVGARYVREISESSSTELTHSQSKALDYVLDDYAVDVLLEKIKDLDNFNEIISEASEGDLVHFRGNFRLFDFDMLKKITNSDTTSILFDDEPDDMKEVNRQIKLLKAQKNLPSQSRAELKEQEAILKQYKINQQKSKEGIETINKAATFADNILGGSIFVQTDSSLSLCKRECFRLSQGQLTMLAETNRKLTLLALVSSIKENVHKDGNFSEFSTHDLNKIPSMFTDMFMSNFNLIKKGDRVLTPIALFFE